MKNLTYVFALSLLPLMASAHQGKTNRQGCHHDHQRGGYHCHGNNHQDFQSPAERPKQFVKNERLIKQVSTQTLIQVNSSTALPHDASNSHTVSASLLNAQGSLQDEAEDAASLAPQIFYTRHPETYNTRGFEVYPNPAGPPAHRPLYNVAGFEIKVAGALDNRPYARPYLPAEIPVGVVESIDMPQPYSRPSRFGLDNKTTDLGATGPYSPASLKETLIAHP